jgi:nitroreductase
MYNPTAIIIPSNERDSVWGRDDNACALQNIFLAAKSYNVGSVWINQLNNICDEPKIREILNEIEIPENHIVYGLAALGYPDPNIEERPYREIGEVNFIK